MRRGRRTGNDTVVVYLALTGDARSMAGFAVSRTVGGAVTRNLITRRLRAILAELLPTLPSGTRVVVRALPAAAAAPYDALRGDVSDAMSRSLAKAR
jgi:ribonuclease P protein component